jgi:hypothetical protein
MKKGKWIIKCFLAGAVLLSLVGGVVMILWNWLIPLLFHGPEVNFPETLGLLLLSRIFLGGWGSGRFPNIGSGWKQRYIDKLAVMTEEERERFKSRMREKWCHAGTKPA